MMTSELALSGLSRGDACFNLQDVPTDPVLGRSGCYASNNTGKGLLSKEQGVSPRPENPSGINAIAAVA